MRGRLYRVLEATPEHRALHYYVKSCLCASSMPVNVEEAMRKIDEGGAAGALRPEELLGRVVSFLDGGERVLLLLGEAGVGKSMLTVWLAEKLISHPRGDELLAVRVELRHLSHAEFELGLSHVLKKAADSQAGKASGTERTTSSDTTHSSSSTAPPRSRMDVACS